MSDPIEEIKQCRAEVDEALKELHEKVDGKTLTPAEIEDIAEKAADKAVHKLTEMAYLEIGKGVVSKALKIVGIIFAFMAFYWHDKIWPR